MRCGYNFSKILKKVSLDLLADDFLSDIATCVDDENDFRFARCSSHSYFSIIKASISKIHRDELW